MIEDNRRDYGEVRYRAFGRVDDEGRCLAFAITAALVRNKGGRPKRSNKVQVALRIDVDALERFKAVDPAGSPA